VCRLVPGLTGAIVGVGTGTRPSALPWGIARRIVWAWILTIPAAAISAGVSSALLGWRR
jgi:PiT family inorganic phosphate transporter